LVDLKLKRILVAIAAFFMGMMQYMYAAEPADDLLETVRFSAPKERGILEVVTGKFGTAQQFKFEKEARSTFFTSNFRGQPNWDEAAGFSFWVKGDGSQSFGGLEFIYDDDYAVRYDLMFSTSSKDWVKVVVAWDDLIPVLPGAKCKPMVVKTGNKPSKLSALFVGKWWYWQDYPAHTFTIDGFSLEKEILRDKVHIPADKPLSRLRKKLEKGEPISIITMGDSLTDFHHWANRKDAWPVLLQASLEAKYKSKVTLHNPAIGGTQLRQNLVLIPRWLAEVAEPDLVTVCFGGNDWEGGMRGAEFLAANIDAVSRIRRMTHGKADVLLMTSVPSVAQWQTRAELAQACRAAAKEQNCGLADTEAAFLLAGKENKERLFGFDKVHLGPEGHQLVAKTLLEAIEAAK
jgi:lysophospholipase L1-like esterase